MGRTMMPPCDPGGVRKLEDPLVDAIDGGWFAGFVAGGAALAQDGGIGQGVRRGCNVVRGGLASGGDGRRSLGEGTRAGYHGLGPDVLHEIGAVEVAGAAIPQVTREPDFLVIGGPQHVWIGQVLAPVNAVDLPGEVHAVTRGAILQGRIVADDALLCGGASAAVDEAEILVAGRAL